ncbi:Proteasome subunit beta type-3 [Sparganum proliferum]
MRGKDCVAIATDLRFGIQYQTISTEFSKVEQLGPRLFVGFPGLATDKETVFQRLQFRKNMYELRENQPIVVGLDPITEEPFVGSMDLIGSALETDEFVAAGSCPEQLYGMCETLWEKDLKSDELFECISQCMLNALNRDCIAGWGTRVYLIEKDQVTISDIKSRMD